MFKYLGFKYDIDGNKQFQILDTSDNVKEFISLKDLRLCKTKGINIEDLKKSDIVPFKTLEEIKGYYSGLRGDYIDSIHSMVSKACEKFSSSDFNNYLGLYVLGWDKSWWYDMKVPKKLRVKCNNTVELTHLWIEFCSRNHINLSDLSCIKIVG